jgi:hypothetical protein
VKAWRLKRLIEQASKVNPGCTAYVLEQLPDALLEEALTKIIKAGRKAA